MGALCELLRQALEYARTHPEEVSEALRGHLGLAGVPLAVGTILGVPIGLWNARAVLSGGNGLGRTVPAILLNAITSLRTIPSLAILFVAIPYLGLTAQAAMVALTLLVLPPIAINTDIAFRTLEPSILEAARGMGMTPWQQLRQVELPLALPTLVAGVKNATIEAIASATLAAFIGAGGFGSFIVLGFALYDRAILLVGAVPVALLALVAEVSLSGLQRAISQKGNS
ncbi:MAG: ABC transporter permease [Cyanobacteria bacterium J06641_5]